MTKNEFLKQLTKALSKLPKNEQENIIKEYEEMFDDRMLEGLTEAEIIKELDAPKVIADAFYEELGVIHQVETTMQGRSNLGLYIMMQFATWLFLFWIWIAFVVVCISIVISGGAFVLLSLTMGLAYTTLSLLGVISMFFVFMGAGLLLIVGGLVATKYCLRINKHYFKWLRQLKGGYQIENY